MFFKEKKIPNTINMQIEKIIYETTRGIYSVEDKLSIATIFIFCWKLNSKLFAELLYCKDHIKFIESLNTGYSGYEIILTIKLDDKNIRDSFYKTLEKVKEKYDRNGYYKALFEGDKFALAVYDIINCDLIKIEPKQTYWR